MSLDGTCKDCRHWQGRWWDESGNVEDDCTFMPQTVRKRAMDKCGQFHHRYEVE